MASRRALRAGGGIVALLGLLLLFVYATGRGWLGEVVPAGEPAARRIPAAVVAQRGADAEQILFGDLHVHTGFSTDAFVGSLPLAGGDGAYTVADACDFARHCSGLDFWSINDHAIGSTPRRWRETVDTLRRCNAIAGDDGADPDVVAFLGWEWTQMGSTPENHWGHKNVVLRSLEDGEIPTRPIAADSPFDTFRPLPTMGLGLLPLVGGDRAYFDAAASLQEIFSVPRCPDGVAVRDLPDDCREFTATPAQLFRKLDDWGHEAIVIPHGTTWGNYTPAGASFDKQLDGGNHDPARQRLVEIFSGHGGTEEHRPWRAARVAADGSPSCPAPSDGYLPSCWRAGEIARERCARAGEPAATCERRAAEARRFFVEAPGVTGHLTIGRADPEDWSRSGQCLDCFLPAFNFRPGSSVQAMLAYRRFEPAAPRSFRFGFIGSSDNHTARPGTGYKEYERLEMTDVRLGRVQLVGSTPLPEREEPIAVDPWDRPPTDWIERERLTSYFYTGGLAAVHADGRSRDAIWEALERREVYATSGPRILLWFDLTNAPGAAAPLPMGSQTRMAEAPRFRVRAVGSRKQRPGCPEDLAGGLPPDRVERLCRGECFHPGDERRLVTRIEIVRVRPRVHRDEALENLITDPWRRFDCPPDPSGCEVELEDGDFAAAARDAIYYARAVEEPSRGIGVSPPSCAASSEDCLQEVEQRAWSSPVFVDFGPSPASTQPERSPS